MNPHLSEEQIATWLTGERTLDVERHVRECQECAGELAGTERAFTLFRESGRRWSEHWYTGIKVAPPAVLHYSIVTRRWMLGSALATLAFAGVMLIRSPAPLVRHEELFTGIPFVVPPAPYERTSVVRMEVPVAALLSAGLRVPLADAAGSVPADVWIGQDGRALAVRLLHDSDFHPDRR